MPRTADGFTNEHTLVQRSAVMSAFAADGKPVGRDVDEEYRFPERVPSDELAGRNAARVEPDCEIGAGQLVGVLAHFCLLSRFCAASRWATNAGATLATRSFTWAF